MIRTLVIVTCIFCKLPSQAMDRAVLDACEATLSRLYEECKAEHTAQECNRAITTRLCKFSWNEDYGAFIDRRIEESAAPGLPYVFTGLSKIKPTYAVAGGK